MLHDDLYAWIKTQDWSTLTEAQAWAKLKEHAPGQPELFVDLTITVAEGYVAAITLTDEDYRVYHRIWSSK